MPDILFEELRGVLNPPPGPVQEPEPIIGEQIEMFEEWEKQGLPALFEPAQLKGK
jgi:hypothetical protein